MTRVIIQTLETTGSTGQVFVRDTASADGGAWAAVGAGSTADFLGTTGADVDVGSAAPPSAGQVLTATDATHATWQTPSGGGGTYGGADVTFAVNDYSKTISIVDAGVSAGSDIVVSVAKAAGRDADEFELSPVHAQVDTVTAGVGFTVFVACPTGDADGAFTIKYTRD